MILGLILGLAMTAASRADTVVLEHGARNPAYAPDGRVAVELHGDLWILDPRSPEARPVRVTSGPAWDGEPAWMPDGSTLVFASDRAGSLDLWQVGVGAAGALAGPAPLVATPAEEREPAVAPDGSVIFVRGRGATADLWIRRPDGGETRLTEELGAERSPALSPDGRQVAYVAERTGQRQLRIRPLDGGKERRIARDLAVGHPAWSPEGDRLAFTAGGQRAGVWVTPADGRYTNLVSERRAAPAWSPDGRLLLADLPREDASYNGDPERVRDRETGGAVSGTGRLWLLEPSAIPDAGLTEVPVRATVDRTAYNADAFDRVWNRLSALYFAGPETGSGRAEWERLRPTLRARALAATSETELQQAIHAILRERPAFRPEASGRAAVSSAHPLATAAGMEMLRRGGNVVDAAVAVSFALGVVEPDASGIGGYGSMLIFQQGMDEPAEIEFLTRVPQAATLENGALLGSDGKLPQDGPVLANVPGTVAGMWAAWKKFGSGKVPWAELIEPAIQLAERGFELDEAFSTTLRVERERYEKYPSSRDLFFHNGEPLGSGDTLRNPDLAWTLREIAREGAGAFYRGEIARRMVADLHGKGNAIRLHDLERYYAVEKAPVRGTYRGHTIYSSAPAISGGVGLVARLNLLEQVKTVRPYTEDPATLHAMIEAWKLIPSSNRRIADPGLWPVDVEPFLSKDTARVRWRCFDPQRSSDPELPGQDSTTCSPGGRIPAEGGAEGVLDCPDGEQASRGRGCRMTGTTAFVVADARGNMVAVTQTLGTWGGNFYVTPGLGFLYNDKLRSYGTDPDSFNARIPFARNVTSISPTLVFRGTGARKQPLLAVGAAGNAWITSAVYQTLTGIVDQGLGPQRALELPRFLVATERRPDGERETVVQIEDGYAPSVLDRLREYGHEFQIISAKGELRMGYGAAVLVDGDRVRAGADPRRSGSAGSIP